MPDHLIIGCGVIGLTTALELLRRGQSVKLLDAAPHEGLGASFANGGLLTPSMSDPWNTPGVHRHLLQYLTRSDSALKIRLSALPSLLTWGPRFLLNSRPRRYQSTTVANLEMATYSLAVLRDLRETHNLSFEASDNGSLKIFRSAEDMEAALGLTRVLQQHGLKAGIVDRDGAVLLEPCLAGVRDDLVGAIFYPQDGTGDAHLFCRAAAERVQALGGEIEYGRTIQSIEIRDGRVTGVRHQEGLISVDQVIVAGGVASPGLTANLGLDLPVQPVKGYSVTYRPDPSRSFPKRSVVDDALHAAVTPIGSRLRAAGTAEFAGHDARVDSRRVDNLARLIKAIYPDIMDEQTLAEGTAWAGLRPVSSDGRPFIGRGPVRGLWVNTGHGHLGWTMSAGSARLLADLIEGAPTEIDPEPFRVGR